MVEVPGGIMRKTMLAVVPTWIHPNYITIVRGLLVVPVVLLKDRPIWAISLLTLSSAFDILDGALARARDQRSEWGAILDPLSDKVFILGTLYFTCWHRVPWLIILTITTLEVFLMALRPLKRLLGARSDANQFGAAKTWVQSFALAFVLTGNPKLYSYSPYLFGAALALAGCSLHGHYRDISRRL